MECCCVEKELKKRQCLLHTNQIKDLRESFNPSICSRNTEKIATIEKLTWAAILTSMTVGATVVIKSIWVSATSWKVLSSTALVGAAWLMRIWITACWASWQLLRGSQGILSISIQGSDALSITILSVAAEHHPIYLALQQISEQPTAGKDTMWWMVW